MTHSLYIVTGASKGIGHAMATQLEKNAANRVLRLARSNPHHLPNLIQTDLTDATKSAEVMTAWLKAHMDGAGAFYLINNAGTVEPMAKIGLLDIDKLQMAVLLNVAAPIAFTNNFVATLKDVSAPKYVMNISSGAGRSALVGWGPYCATKAGLDMFTRVLIEEQVEEAHPVKATSIAPGVIETDIQVLNRQQDPEKFPLQAMFTEMKNSGKLDTPEGCAGKLLKYLHSDQMGTKPITDVREV